MNLSDVEFEPRYLAVLQNMEAMIVRIYREAPELTDFQVDKALAGLMRLYQAEKKAKSAPTLKFGALDQRVYEDVQAICQMYLGRTSLPDTEEIAENDPYTVDEIIACLKRLRESISLWTKEFGRIGYLRYITQFL